MRRLTPLLMLLLGACPQPGGGEGDAGLADLAVPADAPPADEDLAGAGAGECVVPADCQAMDTPPSVRFCPRSAWSCVAGRCTWECTGRRICSLRPGGCLSCDGEAPVCKAAACSGAITRKMPMIDEALCARGFLLEIDRCFGGFVQLKDGTLCTLEGLPTGLERELLACGRCQTAIVY
jgi:hypothetical protein